MNTDKYRGDHFLTLVGQLPARLSCLGFHKLFRDQEINNQQCLQRQFAQIKV